MSLLGILSPRPSRLSGFRLHVKVDKEKAREESSQKHSKVGTELNLKRERLRRESLNNRVHGESRGRDSGRDRGDGSLLHVEAGLNSPLGN